KAMIGPVVHTLEVTPAPDGTVRGTLDLTADQVAALRQEALYVQIHSEGNAGGELRGWILGADAPTPFMAGDLGFSAIDGFVPVTDDMLANPDPADWPMIRRDYHATSFSPLDQIDRDNVGNLQLEWVWSMRDGTSEPSPLVYGGIIYLTSPGNLIQALDGRTGDLIWEHASGPEDNQDMRNIAIYQD